MKPELVTNRKASIFGQGLISRQRKTSAQPSFFDQFGTPAAAYSLRDLSGTNPAVIEVRRSSDNAVQDFTASEITDGSLATWVGAGNDGFVRTWYNQGSLSSRDALQTTAASQPLIVEQGVLVVDNGLPAVKGNGAQQIPFTYTEFTNDFTFLSVQNGVGFLYGASSPGGNDYVKYNVTTRMDMDGSVYQVVDNRDNLQTLSTFNKNVSNSLSMLNNGVETLPSPFAGATGNFSMRSIFSYNTSIFWTGLIQEQIFYNSDIGSNLSDAQTNVNDYYSIY